MKRTITVAAAALAGLALGGCAGNPINYAQRHADAGHYDGDPSRSRALNVAVATGLTECENGQCAPLADVPREKLPESLQAVDNTDIIDELSDAWSLGHAVGQFSGTATTLTGLTNFGSGLYLLGGFLLEPSTMDDPAARATMVSWMPATKADTPNLARERLIRLVRQATPSQFHAYKASNTGHDENLVRINFTGNAACNAPYVCDLIFYANKPWLVTDSPAWLAQGPTYAWTNWRRGQTNHGQFHSINITHARVDTTNGEVPWPDDLNRRAYLAKLSANLPAWVYIYLPPTDAHNYPVMLNQGKPLLFIEPRGTEGEVASR